MLKGLKQAALAAAVALAVGGPALAAGSAHEHGAHEHGAHEHGAHEHGAHEHGAHETTLTLDHGRKWQTDAPLRQGMSNIRGAVRELDTYALGSGEQRFADWLLRAVQPVERGAVSVTLPAAKRAIASRLNLSAEHLSRILRHLVAEGLIEVRGRTVDIPDVARLRRFDAP